MKTTSTRQNRALLECPEFLGRAATAEVAVRLNSVEGIIYCQDLRSMSEEDILQNSPLRGSPK